MSASTKIKNSVNYWNNKPLITNSSNFHVNSENKSSIIDSLSKELDILKQNLDSSNFVDILNIRDPKQKMEWCDFINTHYQDVTPQMSLHYTNSLINYMFSHKHITFVLRNKSRNQIIATISGFFFNNTFFEKKYNTLHCTFLCIHKNFREKYLAPFLITYFGLYAFKTYKNLHHIFFTTSNQYSDQPFHTSHFFHRPLCIQNLIDTQFLPDTINKEVYRKIYEKKVKIGALEILDKDILLEKCSLDTLSNQFNQFYKMNNVDISYHYTPQFLQNILKCPDFVLVGEFDRSKSKLDNVFIFNKLYYKNGFGTLVKNVLLHSYFYKSESKFQELFDSVSYLLKSEFDVITCLDILPESPLKYKFINGTGKIHYYLYNCNVPKITRNRLSVV